MGMQLTALMQASRVRNKLEGVRVADCFRSRCFEDIRNVETMPQSAEEKKIKKKLAQRKRIEKIKQDPDKYALYRLKEKERYLKKKKEDTRETGFVNAITAAGVTYAITRACTAGALLECSCEKGAPKSRRGKAITVPTPPVTTQSDRWQWGGCSDNVRFGLQKSREFMDSRYRKRSDIKTLIKLHNHNAGRLAIKSNMRIECKCHGLSGSCTLRTCWWRMPAFREVGDRLRDKFEGAAKVISNNDGDNFMPESTNIKQPGKKDIVYSEQSPDFCVPNAKTGSLGTEGRQCNVSSAGTDGCDQLCCRRGFTQTTVREPENCNCHFKWCCEVICETCFVKREIQTCL